jgi:TonB family protein
MKRFTKNLFISALLVSLFIHLGAGLIVYLKRLPKQKEKSVEFVIIDKPKTKNIDLKNNAKQFVEQSEKRINNEIDEKTKYLSRYDQKVVEQTRAANSGKFQNDAKMGEALKTPDSKKMQEKKEVVKNDTKTTKQKIEPSEHGDVPLPKLVDLKPQFHWDKVPSGVENPGPISQSDDFLKDLQKGPQTLLSSREFIYYSYYTRIKERLRLYWEPKIKEKVTRIFAQGRHIASDEEKITRLIITLDQTGKLIKVQVLTASGVSDLDDAAVEAFQAAAPFPNPPKGIIDADGTIKIRWDFILEANSKIFSPVRDIATN